EAPRRPSVFLFLERFLFPPPTRPASIRTLWGAFAPVPVAVLLPVNGAAISEPNWTFSLLETPVPPPCRSHPNPAMGSQKPLQHILSCCFEQLPAWLLRRGSYTSPPTHQRLPPPS